MNQIDHLVIAAETLEQGVIWAKQTFAVDVPAGGFHKTMATHNHLMQLGNDIYLEIVAINPDATPPSQPRWFALDSMTMRESLKHGPRLITWMINTTDLNSLVNQAIFDYGQITELERNNLRWKVALSDDGRLIADGMVPHAIEWQTSPHPSRGMADPGCRLKNLTIYHNRMQWLQEKLQSIAVDHLVTVKSIDDDQSPYLSASIQCPNGEVTITSLINHR